MYSYEMGFLFLERFIWKALDDNARRKRKSDHHPWLFIVKTEQPHNTACSLLDVDNYYCEMLLNNSLLYSVLWNKYCNSLNVLILEALDTSV